MRKQTFTRFLLRTGTFLVWVGLLASPGIFAKNIPGRPGPQNRFALAPAAAGDTVRLNCGGEQIVAADGKVFAADNYFVGGRASANTAVADVLQTTDDALYRTEHSAIVDLVPFAYNIPVRAGTYAVRLHFAEIYFGATGGGAGGSGKRVFSVALEGSPVLVNFDVTAAAGGPMTAVVREFQTVVSDGALNLTFAASVDQPTVAAIEVLRVAGLGPQPLPSCNWVEVAHPALERKEGQSAAVDDQIYTFGGYYGALLGTNLTQRFDEATGLWTTLAPAPYAVTHMGVAVVDKKVWLIGGFAGDNPGPVTAAVQVYDTRTNTWALGPPLPAPRGSNAAAVVGHKIHAYGGLLPDRRTDAADHYVLDVDNVAAGWQTAAPLPEPRNHLGGASVGGKIYAIGGQNDHDGVRNIGHFVHVYDPATNAWTRLADLPVNRSHFEPGTIALDGKILIVGGSQNFSDYADILVYDPVANTWAKFCDLPATLVAPFAQVVGSTLVVAEGARDNNAVPENTTQTSDITRTPSNVLRFAAAQQTLELAPGGTATVKNLLWTYSNTAAYTFTVSGAPAWLKLPAGGYAGPLGQDVAWQVNAAGLAAGTYSATVRATAPGYAAAATTITLTVTAARAPGTVVFAVHAGGEAYTAADGVVYQSDRNFTGGSTYATAAPIAGTTEDGLYQTERYGDFSYAVPVPNGAYRVTFKLAEIYWTAAQRRVFDVLAEGQAVVSGLDVYAQAGANAALDLVRTVTVADGTLDLRFRTTADNAKLSALLVQTAPAASPAVASAALQGASAGNLPKTWRLFPNPVAESATLSFAAAAAQPVRVEVLSSQARTVWQSTQQTSAGINEVKISTAAIPAGAYIVRVYLREGVINERMMVVR